jgi:hypothetical protein
MAKYEPGAARSSQALLAWDGVQIVKQVAASSKAYTGTALLAAIRKASHVTAEGLAGRLDYAAPDAKAGSRVSGIRRAPTCCPTAKRWSFSNAALRIGVEHFRGGRGVVYDEGESYVSRLRLDPDGLHMDVERLITGLTATQGLDIHGTGTAALPAGTVFAVSGGAPVVDSSLALVTDAARVRQHLLAYHPASGEVLGRVPLWAESPLVKRFGPVTQPNGLAVDPAGDLYFSDIPNGNADPDGPPSSVAAVYRIPHDAIDGVIAGQDSAVAAVQRVSMPQTWVNGVASSKADGSIHAVSCYKHDPVHGGVFRLLPENFAADVLPDPIFRDLGGELRVLDGIGVTRRGTVIATSPTLQIIHALSLDGTRRILRYDGDDTLGNPADVNVCYPPFLKGEPALVVPDVSVGPGSNSVTVVSLEGL